MTNPDIANQNRRRPASLPVFKPGSTMGDERRFPIEPDWISSGVGPLDLVTLSPLKAAISRFSNHNIKGRTRLQLANHSLIDSARSEGNDGYATKHMVSDLSTGFWHQPEAPGSSPGVPAIFSTSRAKAQDATIGRAQAGLCGLLRSAPLL